MAMPAIARRVVSLALVAVAKLAHRSISPDLLAVRTFAKSVRQGCGMCGSQSELEARRVHTPRCREQGACTPRGVGRKARAHPAVSGARRVHSYCSLALV